MKNKATNTEHSGSFATGATASPKDATKRSLPKTSGDGSTRQPIYKGQRQKHFNSNTDPGIPKSRKS